MSIVDYGNVLDLRDRLQFTTSRGDRRLVPVFGSGISNSVIADITKITTLFRDALPSAEARQRFDAAIAEAADAPARYQLAASLARRAVGDSGVMSCVVRPAVLAACPAVAETDVATVARDVAACTALEDSDDWIVPEAYTEFARFYASLDGKERGPIVTTNFDPLIEVALRRAGLDVYPFPIPLDTAPTLDQLHHLTTAVPVLHIHGYWTDPGSCNTMRHLAADRPRLDVLLRQLIKTSCTLVVAYSGWADAFMRGLGNLVKEATLLDAEVLWAAHDEDPGRVLANPTLAAMSASPGFTLYLGVDAEALFRVEAPTGPDAVRPAQPDVLPDPEPATSPFGYTRVPPKASPPPLPGVVGFADGAQPTWRDALPGEWPMLAATKQMIEGAETWIRAGGGGGVIALGPVGEGKTLAIRQAAVAVAAAHPGWTVLWREPGAPTLSAEWLERVLETYGQVVVVVDDADLVATDLAHTAKQWQQPDSGVVLLLASNDRLWRRYGGTIRGLDDIVFQGLTPDEAVDISRAWKSKGLLPPAANDDEAQVEELARRLHQSAMSMSAGHQSTLFGAVLDVRFGDALGARVRDLVAKLNLTTPRKGVDVSLGDIFGGVCLMQETFDRYGDLAKGASRNLIAAMLGLDGIFADGAVLRSLGREAAITYAGDRVYSRHPAIARATLQQMRASGQIHFVAELVGKGGGRLRNASGTARSEYYDAYLLGRHLSGEESVSAARGAIEGSGKLLEPRVTMLSVLRRRDHQHAETYARGVAPHLNEFTDQGGAIRAYLVEFSIVTRSNRLASLSVGLAALSMHDGLGFALDKQRAAYSLTAVAKAAVELRKQNKKLAGDVPEAAATLVNRGRSSEESMEQVRRLTLDQDAMARQDQLSTGTICARLAAALRPFVSDAIRDAKLALPADLVLSLQDLQQVVHQATTPR